MELSAANDAIRLVTASAGAVHAQAGWADETVHPVVSQAGPVSVMPGRFAAVVTTAATTTLVSAPGGAVRRRLTALHVANRHATDANAVSVEFWDGAAAAVLYKRTLAAGESISYAEGRWVLYDAAGVPVGVGAQGPPGPVNTSGTPAVGSFARFTAPATIEGRIPADARADLGLVIGTNVQAYDATLAALAAYNTNGLLTQTAADAFAGRAIAGTVNKISVSNGDGVAGNPVITIPDTPTLVTPTIASFVNAGHTHADAAGGAQLTDAALSAAVGVAKGGTGQTTAQAAINALTAVAAATNEHVLTKDTTTGNAVFKAASGGGSATRTMFVPFFEADETSGEASWVNMPLALTVFRGVTSNHTTRRLDLTSANDVRFVYAVSVGGNGGKLLLRYSTDNSAYTTMTGTTVAFVSGPGDAIYDSGWQALDAGAKAAVYIKPYGQDGDGVGDPRFVWLTAQFR